MIEACAALPHYEDHLRPVLEALGGVKLWRHDPPPGDIPTLCASLQDLRRARRARRPVILMEHGAGQSYIDGARDAYIGGKDRAGVIAALVPGFGQAASHRRAHPEIPVFVVGCPKLDTMRASGAETVISFHWNCPNNPETRNAFAHYTPALPGLAGHVGHAHPRAWTNISRVYRRAGLEPVEHFADAIGRAGVYICDNSSTIFEAAALDVPLVILNAPHYRRDVEHGMRFWELADVGVQVDDPAQLPDAIVEALEDPPERRRRRREVADIVYAHRSCATTTAADAIREVTS